MAAEFAVPPSGVCVPPCSSMTTVASVVGLPSASFAQPMGSGKFSLYLLRTLPPATVVVAISKLNVLLRLVGAAKAMGLVENFGSLPNVGATLRRAADVVAIPTKPSAAIMRV